MQSIMGPRWLSSMFAVALFAIPVTTGFAQIQTVRAPTPPTDAQLARVAPRQPRPDRQMFNSAPRDVRLTSAGHLTGQQRC